jgi:hypothetical protein
MEVAKTPEEVMSSSVAQRLGFPLRRRSWGVAALLIGGAAASALLTACGGSSAAKSAGSPRSSSQTQTAHGPSGSATASSLDEKLSHLEGYRVSGCHPYPPGNQLAREVADYGARSYQCDGALGVMLESDGDISDFDAPQTGPPKLSAAIVSQRLASAVKREAGAAPRSVDCGQSRDVQDGDSLPCSVILSNGKAIELQATVSLRSGVYDVKVSAASGASQGTTSTSTSVPPTAGSTSPDTTSSSQNAGEATTCGSTEEPYEGGGPTLKWVIYVAGSASCRQGKQALDTVLAGGVHISGGPGDANEYLSVGDWRCAVVQMGFETCWTPQTGQKQGGAVAASCRYSNIGCPAQISERDVLP